MELKKRDREEEGRGEREDKGGKRERFQCMVNAHENIMYEESKWRGKEYSEYKREGGVAEYLLGYGYFTIWGGKHTLNFFGGWIMIYDRSAPTQSMLAFYRSFWETNIHCSSTFFLFEILLYLNWTK